MESFNEAEQNRFNIRGAELETGNYPLNHSTGSGKNEHVVESRGSFFRP
jgi:hypothetical protein